MLEIIKSATEREAFFARRLSDFRTGEEDEARGLLEEIDALNRAKAELRTKLRESQVIKAGVDLLDRLIDQLDGPMPELWQIPSDTVMSADFETHEDPAAAPKDHAAIRAAIDAEYPYSLQFYDQWGDYGKPEREAQAAILVATPQPSNVERSNIGYPVEDPEQLNYVATDNFVGSSLNATRGSVNQERFKLNMMRFEGVVSRPPKIAAAAQGQFSFGSRADTVLLVEDNMFHVRHYIAHMKRKHLLVEPLDEAHLGRVLRRMWAIVAIMYGCEKEGSLWLTVMDALLEELARMVVGHLDERLPTTSGRYVQHILQQYTNRQRGDPAVNTAINPVAAEDIRRMELEDRARLLFAELAIMYRGAVMMAYVAVNWGSSLLKYGNWYHGLIEYQSECACDTCCEALEVAYNPNRRPRYGLNVGIKDQRIGFPDQRSLVSENRLSNYPCLWSVFAKNRWHPGFGPFFYHFAHLYHVGCKHYRGKPTFVRIVNRGRELEPVETMVAAGLLEFEDI